MKRIGLAISLFALVATAKKGKWEPKDDQKDRKKVEKGWKSARDHWNPNQVQHDTQAGMALIGNTKILLPGAVRREAGKEAAKINNAKMEQCKTAVCKIDCQGDDKSVGCKYCVLKTCLKRTPKAGTCAKNKCIDAFATKRKWISCMFEHCESKDGGKQAGPLSARSFGDSTGANDSAESDAVKDTPKWNGKGKGKRKEKSDTEKNTYASKAGKGGKVRGENNSMESVSNSKGRKERGGKGEWKRKNGKGR
jgi:hypothetical protein